MSERKPGTGEAQGLLARWSARKAKVREAERALEAQAEQGQGPPPSAVPAPVPPEAGAEPQAPEDAVPERELTDEDMPPVETLNERSDLSMFFSSKVSEELRRRALRKVFMSAAFNRVDGLDDYAEDFTQFEALGDVMTADLKHRLERERERLAQALDGEQADVETRTGTSADDSTEIAADEAGSEMAPDAPEDGTAEEGEDGERAEADETPGGHRA